MSAADSDIFHVEVRHGPGPDHTAVTQVEVVDVGVQRRRGVGAYDVTLRIRAEPTMIPRGRTKRQTLIEAVALICSDRTIIVGEGEVNEGLDEDDDDR